MIKSIDKDYFFELVDCLIKEYRGIEKERRMFYRGNVYTANQLKNSIPKSKIKEKIEELNMSGGSNGQDNVENLARELSIEVLQELMEDK